MYSQENDSVWCCINVLLMYSQENDSVLCCINVLLMYSQENNSVWCSINVLLMYSQENNGMSLLLESKRKFLLDIVVISEKWTFKANVDFRGTVPLGVLCINHFITILCGAIKLFLCFFICSGAFKYCEYSEANNANSK